MEKLYLVDALNILFKSYYAIPPSLTNAKGEQTNAIYGFVRSLYKILKDFHPSHIVIVFDGPNNKASRQKIFKEYKAHRKVMDDAFYQQIAFAQMFCEVAGFPMLCEDGYEADDVIGGVVKWAEKKGAHSYIISADKDLCQLVNENTSVININKDNLLITPPKVKDVLGVRPDQVIDLLALMGDSADNIPGLPGIGPKTAVAWLEKFDTLDKILANPQEFKGKKKEVIEEHADLALMSRQLATIVLDSDIPHDVEFYKLQNPDVEKTKEFYREMNFKKLLEEMESATGTEESQTSEEAPKGTYHLVESADALDALLQKLQKEKVIVFDTETTALHPISNELVGIGLGTKPGEAWYIPLNGNIDKEVVIQKVKPLFENENIQFAAHNIKFDMHILKRYGIDVKNCYFDTMIAAYLLSPGVGKYGLDPLCLELFNVKKTPYESIVGKGAKQKSMKEIDVATVSNYCCEDVDYTCRLFHYFQKELEKEKELEKIFFEMEMPLTKVLVEMEQSGIYIDKEKLAAMSHYLTEEIEKVEKEIHEIAGDEVNLNSPKQVGEVLFVKMGIPGGKKTQTGYSTSAEVLHKLAPEHPIAAKLLTYRMLEKLRSTYVDALPTQIDPNTHRIHCNFMQTVAATGRLSCQSPNLQNIPVRGEEGKKIRATFVPEQKESIFLAADYSQIELRLLAHMSEDPGLVSAFNNGEDVHAATAAKVFDVPLKHVTKEMRHKAKAVNFGVIYGQQAFGLSQGLSIDYKEAKKFIKTYFEKYEKVAAFIDNSIEEARSTQTSTTLMGRKRMLKDINAKNPFIKKAAERLAINSPLQGSAADLIKVAMINISKKIAKENLKARMILQIHDELVFELPESEKAKLEKIVRMEMESVMRLKVPLIVDIKVGKNWGEC